MDKILQILVTKSQIVFTFRSNIKIKIKYYPSLLIMIGFPSFNCGSLVKVQ